MPLVVSDELLLSLGMSEAEIRLELAFLLFERGRCSLARASRFAGVSRLRFQKLLADRGIPIHYGTEEFRQDLKHLNEVGLI